MKNKKHTSCFYSNWILFISTSSTVFIILKFLSRSFFCFIRFLISQKSIRFIKNIMHQIHATLKRTQKQRSWFFLTFFFIFLDFFLLYNYFWLWGFSIVDFYRFSTVDDLLNCFHLQIAFDCRATELIQPQDWVSKFWLTDFVLKSDFFCF